MAHPNNQAVGVTLDAVPLTAYEKELDARLLCLTPYLQQQTNHQGRVDINTARSETKVRVEFARVLID